MGLKGDKFSQSPPKNDYELWIVNKKWSWGPGTIRRPTVYEQPSQKINCLVRTQKTITNKHFSHGAKTASEVMDWHLS
jgi:hypothetical protein